MRSAIQSESASRQAIFLRILDEYRPALWRLVSCYEPNPSRREDLYQDIALGLWQAIPRFRGESSERTWLYRIAHNIAISWAQSRRRRDHQELSIPNSLERPSSTIQADQMLLLQEKRHAMLSALRELAPLDRQLMVLHLEGLSYQEIEQVSGLSESAIGSRLSRIRDRLSERIHNKEVPS